MYTMFGKWWRRRKLRNTGYITTVPSRVFNGMADTEDKPNAPLKRAVQKAPATVRPAPAPSSTPPRWTASTSTGPTYTTWGTDSSSSSSSDSGCSSSSDSGSSSGSCDSGSF